MAAVDSYPTVTVNPHHHLIEAYRLRGTALMSVVQKTAIDVSIDQTEAGTDLVILTKSINLDRLIRSEVTIGERQKTIPMYSA